MKNNVLILLFIVTLFSCQKNEGSTLVARLSIIGDGVHPLIDHNDTIYRRFVGLHYKMINNTNDSVYIPIGYPYNHYTSVRVLKDFVDVRVCEEYVWKEKEPNKREDKSLPSEIKDEPSHSLRRFISFG